MCLLCCYLSSPFSRLLSALPKSRNRFSVKEVKKGKIRERERRRRRRSFESPWEWPVFIRTKIQTPFTLYCRCEQNTAWSLPRWRWCFFEIDAVRFLFFCCLADFFFLFHSSFNWWGAATDCYHFFFSWNCRNLMDAHWKTFSLSIMPFQLKWFLYFLVCLDIPRHGPKDRSITTDPYISPSTRWDVHEERRWCQMKIRATR